MKKFKFSAMLIFSIIFMLACFGDAPAQNASVGITPAAIDAKVKRGASYTQNYTITNNTIERLRFHCSAEDIWYDEQNKRLTGRAGTLPRSASGKFCLRATKRRRRKI